MEIPNPSWPQRLGKAVVGFWLAKFFRLCERAPRLALAARPIICAMAMAASPAVRRAARENARYLLSPRSTRFQRARLLYRTLSSFYLFCFDVARSRGLSVEELRGRVHSVVGREIYDQARAARRGVIVVTAHMGSFEVAMASLRGVEEHVHVLFRRDDIGLFERQRCELRQRLGIHEAALDDGWTVWIKLREALLNDQVVVIQGDRVLPGQKGRCVSVLGGSMELPMAPIKLALATGAPIVPIFSLRNADGGIQLIIKEPVHVSAGEDEGLPLLQWAKVLEQQIATHADQWLMLTPAWQDQSDAQH
jgi:phosphatidylinositol dimannoside acyltransferase